jgi:hypothetical protein
MKNIIFMTILLTISSFARESVDSLNLNKKTLSAIKSKNCEVKISYQNMQHSKTIRTKLYNAKNRLYSLNNMLANSQTYKFLIEFDGKKLEYIANKGEKSWINSCGVKILISKNKNGTNFTSYKIGYNVNVPKR